jgi:hypothetical protein
LLVWSTSFYKSTLSVVVQYRDSFHTRFSATRFILAVINDNEVYFDRYRPRRYPQNSKNAKGSWWRKAEGKKLRKKVFNDKVWRLVRPASRFLAANMGTSASLPSDERLKVGYYFAFAMVGSENLIDRLGILFVESNYQITGVPVA